MAQTVEKSPRRTEPVSLLSCFQKLATSPCPKPEESKPHRHSRFLQNHFNVMHPSDSRTSKWFLSFGFPTKSLYFCSFCACYKSHPSYLPPFDLFKYCLVNSLHCEAPYCEFSSILRLNVGIPTSNLDRGMDSPQYLLFYSIQFCHGRILPLSFHFIVLILFPSTWR